MFFDEITSGIDPDSKKKVANLVKEYNRLYNSSIFLTSHDILEA
jgi:ABC-type multidrug transport system ATPase subunit